MGKLIDFKPSWTRSRPAAPSMSAPAAPSADALSGKKDGLKAVETKVGGGAADPAVVEVYKKAFADNGGDKAKTCAALGLDEGKWGDVKDADSFVKKFLG